MVTGEPLPIGGNGADHRHQSDETVADHHHQSAETVADHHHQSAETVADHCAETVPRVLARHGQESNLLANKLNQEASSIVVSTTRWRLRALDPVASLVLRRMRSPRQVSSS